MHPECHVCNLEVNKNAVLFETHSWRVLLAPDQGYLGRAYVTLKAHKEHLSELSEQEWTEYGALVNRVETACKNGLGATLFNWSCLMNNAYQHKPYAPHIHWHFRPRYEKPVVVNEVTFIDPEFGFHYNRNQHNVVDASLLMEIANRIKSHL